MSNMQRCKNRRKTTNYTLANIKNSWDQTMVGIGDAIVKSGALKLIGDMASELGVWVDANKEMISSKIKGGVDWVQGAFKWAVEHKDEIGTLLSNMTKFIAVVTATNLIVAFSDPMRIAALAVGGMAVAIWNAVEKMKEVRVEETKYQKNKPFRFYESLGAGVSNVAFGIGNAIAGNHEKPVFSQIYGGAAQIAMSPWQAITEGVNWVRREEGDRKPTTGIGKLGEMMGGWSLGIDKYNRPEDYSPNNESVLRNEVIDLNASQAARNASIRESERASTMDTVIAAAIERGFANSRLQFSFNGQPITLENES
jgi:hypothetical protein